MENRRSTPCPGQPDDVTPPDAPSRYATRGPFIAGRLPAGQASLHDEAAPPQSRAKIFILECTNPMQGALCGPRRDRGRGGAQIEKFGRRRGDVRIVRHVGGSAGEPGAVDAAPGGKLADGGRRAATGSTRERRASPSRRTHARVRPRRLVAGRRTGAEPRMPVVPAESLRPIPSSHSQRRSGGSHRCGIRRPHGRSADAAPGRSRRARASAGPRQFSLHARKVAVRPRLQPHFDRRRHRAAAPCPARTPRRSGE